MAHPLVLPMAAHVALAALLYALLTFARAPKVWGIGQRADGSYPWAAIEPRISANLSNQFEWPVFFYAACLLLMQGHLVSTAAVVLAWVFVVGRLAHSCRSEEHTSELQSLMRISYAVFCLKKKKKRSI